MSSPALAELISHTLLSVNNGNTYVPRQMEREFLTKALENGFTVDLARSALLEACRERSITLESAVLRDARHDLAQLAGTSGITEQEFLRIVREAVGRTGGNLTETTVKSILVEIIDDNQYPVKRNLLAANWLENLKRDMAPK